MMDFIQDLERKVGEMKTKSEAAAEELIVLRGRHLELKKRRQCLSQQVAHCIQVSYKQEQAVLKTQEEINEIMRRSNPNATTMSTSLLSPSTPMTDMQTSATEAVATNDISLPQSLLPRGFQLPFESHQQQRPIISSGFVTLSGGNGYNELSPYVVSQPSSTLWAPPMSLNAMAEGKEGWLEGSSLRGLLADAFEDQDQERLSLNDLFSDDTELPVAVHSSKRSKT